MKRIGIVTSGGDAPGMNACIRAATHIAFKNGMEMFGIERGFNGLIRGEVRQLDRFCIENIIHLGGTILGTSRSPEFYSKEGRAKAIKTLERYQMEGLILIGGDGTFKGGTVLSEECGVAVVGLPGTIDNDVYGTDYTIGFDTAVNCALQAIDRIRDTALSHERLFFVEVMGHHTGFIALHSGIAGGAVCMIIPEVPVNTEELCKELSDLYGKGKRSAIVVVAEGDQPGDAFRIAKEVSACAGFESRVCVLGHIQRGGAPTAKDRLLSSRLGVAAVIALKEGKRGIMVGEIGGKIVETPMQDTWEKHKKLDVELQELAKLLAD